MKSVITIDGPAGSGKSSVASYLAQKYGWRHINTGSVYRVAALKILNEDINVEDLSKVIFSVKSIKDKLVMDENAQIFMDGNNLSDLINGPTISEAASQIASVPEVRLALLPVQRELIPSIGVSVVDGRDTGTVVFPDSPLKIFLTASPAARIKRRALDLEAKGIPFSLKDLEIEINERDERDQKREAAPLKPAHDAVIIDSTEYTFSQVVEMIYDLAVKKGLVNFK